MIYPSTQSYYTTLLNLFVFLMKKATGLSFNEPVLPKVFTTARFGGMSIKFRLGEKLEMHFTVPADHEDVPFSIDPITAAQDSEGNQFSAEDLAQFNIPEPTSSNPDVVSIIDDGNGGRAAHFGIPGAALLTSQPTYRGENFGDPITAEFLVPTGAPVSIEGGGLHFGDLQPDA